MEDTKTPQVDSTVDKAVDTASQALNVDVNQLESYAQMFSEMSIQFGTKLLMAILVFIVMQWLIKRLMKTIDIAMEKKGVEITLKQFLHSIIFISFKAIQIVIFASMIGIETASLIAVLGAAGLAIGLALQGSLANFAGGILILFFRPFKAGDFIDAQGYAGKVIEIQIFNTILLTVDNQRVIIPNGLLSNGCVKNVFCESTRRVDMVFGISYSDDIQKTREIISSVLMADSRTLKDPAPDIYVAEHGASSVNFYVRPWIKSEHYWDYHFTIIEQVKLAFDREGITIPFPQRDVHLHQVSS
ncbi:mechanosensitive ion channel family protein [Thalassotalea sediminis]|uniref:mechanosensitive ion channel family protein n=1 Tax=Thalassotalea sediminis TaxID=1759089 RepID=UPI002572AB6B|nr:mechanosensitive ion channel domain-containing protein [Thalassotalea sediminis]